MRVTGLVRDNAVKAFFAAPSIDGAATLSTAIV
jgi:hypothetical protein